MDILSPLLGQIALTARVFYSGELCELASFDASDHVGHLHLIKAGSITIQAPGLESVYIDKPSVVFLPRPRSHSLVPDESSVANLLCASIDLGSGVGSPIAKALPDIVAIPIEGNSEIEPTLHLLFAEAFEGRSGRQAALDRLAEYFLIQVLRHVTGSGMLKTGVFAALADARLAKAVNAMHMKPEHTWSLEELADTAGMSRARFAVNFRAAVGSTPLDYLTDWRISIAKNLLKRGKPIKTVAGAIGYQSPAALTRVFAKRTGMAPTEWIRSTTLG